MSAAHSTIESRIERFGLGLTEAAVRRLQDILRREGEELPLEEAWTRAIEIMAFARILLDALPEKPLPTG